MGQTKGEKLGQSSLVLCLYWIILQNIWCSNFLISVFVCAKLLMISCICLSNGWAICGLIRWLQLIIKKEQLSGNCHETQTSINSRNQASQISKKSRCVQLKERLHNLNSHKNLWNWTKPTETSRISVVRDVADRFWGWQQLTKYRDPRKKWGFGWVHS